MKINNPDYSIRLDSSTKNPRLTVGISFDDNDTDILWLTSHSDCEFPSGATVIENCIEEGSVSNRSQVLDLEKSTSTIGTLSFNIIDLGGALSTIISAKEAAGFGLRRKRVVSYSGFKGQVWDDYELDTTNIITGVDNDEGRYKFSCSDVNRLVRTKIFSMDKGNLLSGVDARDRTFTAAITNFIAATKEITVTPGTYNASNFFSGMTFQVTGSVSNNGTLTVDSVDPENPTTKFTVVEVLINETVAATASHVLRVSITGSDLSKFKPVEHDNSYSTWPLDTVGFIMVEDEVMSHDGPEVDALAGYSIAIRENGRGEFDTAVSGHLLDSGVDSADTSKNPEVKEVGYLEGPAPKLALALLTGTQYGQVGTLPVHWTCEVPSKYIRTSDFIGLGVDFWDTSDDSGRHLQFVFTDEVSGKDFIEKQIMLWMGCFMPIYSNGALGVKRLPSLPNLAGYVETIDDSVTYKRDAIKRNMSKVVNYVSVNWGKILLKSEYTKTTVLIDQDSRDIHNPGNPKAFNFDGVKTGVNTDTDIINYLNSWRDLYSAPPYECSVTVMQRLTKLEVGDAVRVSMPQHMDMVLDTAFDKVMMITSINSTALKGEVRFNLIGPSAYPTPLDLPSSTSKLNPAYYSPGGSAIALTSVLSIIGGVIQGSGSTNLDGTDDMNALGSVYYYDGDLELPDGRELSLFDNVNLRINGFFTINGQITSRGSSNSGGVGDHRIVDVTNFDAATRTLTVAGYATQLTSSYRLEVVNSSNNNGRYTIASIPNDNTIVVNEPLTDEISVTSRIRDILYADLSYDETIKYGISISKETSGDSGFGSNSGGGGLIFYAPRMHTAFSVPRPSLLSQEANAGSPEIGIGSQSRYLSVTTDGDTISGIPQKFTGTGGGGGKGVASLFLSLIHPSNRHFFFTASGGDGGVGGAGLLLTCKGTSLTGVNSSINLSGDGGSSGESVPIDDVYNISSGTAQFTGTGVAYGGAGAGGSPGTCYIMYDGSYTPPNIDGKVISEQGVFPSQGSKVAQPEDFFDRYTSLDITSYYSGSENFIYGNSDAYIQYLPDNLTPVQETPDYTTKPLSISAAELLNTPETLAGDRSTIEVTVTKPVGVTSYGYAKVYYRILGEDDWIYLAPASSSGASSKVVLASVKSDGTSYEFIARSVSLAGNESEEGETTSIKLTNIVALTPASAPDDPTLVAALPISQPQNLALLGGVGSFSGRACHIIWNYNGTPGSTPPEHFKHYRIEVYNASGADTLQRTTETQNNWFEYTEEMAIEDGGPYRELRFDITAVARQLHESATTTGTFTNPQSGAPVSVTISPIFTSVDFSYVPPTDSDWKGIRLYVSDTNGFTADANTLLYDGSNTQLNFSNYMTAGVPTPLVAGNTYYLRYETYDSFDQTGMTLSAQSSFTLTKISSATEIDGLGEWATRLTDVDAAFITANMSNDAIDSTQIAGLVAGKINAGTISSQITISGLFRTAVTGWRVDMGPVVDGITYVFRYHDGIGNDYFSIDESGNVAIEGTITLGGSSTTLTDNNTLNTNTTATDVGLGSVTDGADITSAQISATLNITSGGIVFGDGTTDGGGIRSFSKSSFADTDAGFFLGWDTIGGSAYKFNIGDASNFMSWDGLSLAITGNINGSTITGGTFQTTSSASSGRIVVDGSQNELYCYGDRGNGTIDKIISMGRKLSGSDYYALEVGTNQAGATLGGIYVQARDSWAIYASAIGAGIAGSFIGSSTYAVSISNQGAGIGATVGSATGVGLRAVSNSLTSGAPFKISPSTSSNTPTHSTEVSDGCFWLTSEERLCLRKAGAWKELIVQGLLYSKTWFNQTSGTVYTSIIALDNTTPTISEGTSLLTTSDTKAFSASESYIEIRVSLTISMSSAGYPTCAVWRDTTNLVGVQTSYHTGSMNMINFRFIDTAAAVGTRTYQVNFGPGASRTIYLNGTSTYNHGGNNMSSVTIKEVLY